MTAQEVIDRLRSRHRDREGEWACYQECWAIDFYAMRCQAGGLGYQRVGYEVKVSRADFLSEMRKPHKRANARSLSHLFFFACPEGLIQPNEIPDDAGLVWVYESGRTRARVVKESPVIEPRAFTMREVVYLARWALYREGILAMRQENAQLRGWHDQREQTVNRLSGELRAAHEQLALALAHTLIVGTSWVGSWGRWAYGDEEENVEVELTEIRWYEDGSGPGVTIERVDRPALPRYARRQLLVAGEFLSRYRQVSHENQGTPSSLPA